MSNTESKKILDTMAEMEEVGLDITLLEQQTSQEVEINLFPAVMTMEIAI